MFGIFEIVRAICLIVGFISFVMLVSLIVRFLTNDDYEKKWEEHDDD